MTNPWDPLYGLFHSGVDTNYVDQNSSNEQLIDDVQFEPELLNTAYLNPMQELLDKLVLAQQEINQLARSVRQLELLLGLVPSIQLPEQARTESGKEL